MFLTNDIISAVCLSPLLTRSDSCSVQGECTGSGRSVLCWTGEARATVLTPGATDGDVPLPKLRGQWDTQDWLPPLLVGSENYELGLCSAQHVHPASHNEKPDVGAAGRFGAQPSHHQRDGRTSPSKEVRAPIL